VTDPTAQLQEEMRELMGLAMSYELDTNTGTLTPVWTNLSAKVAYDYMAEKLRCYRAEELTARMRFMGITPRQLMEPYL
jgi:hypothetical protein